MPSTGVRTVPGISLNPPPTCPPKKLEIDTRITSPILQSALRHRV